MSWTRGARRPRRHDPRPQLRGPLARLLEVWGYGEGFDAAHRDVALTARDGVQLAATCLPSTARSAGDPAERPESLPAPQRPAVLVAHGFGAHRRKLPYVRLAEALISCGTVLSLDLRGHGGSHGRCTFGDREALDVRAGAAWLRACGHDWITAVGVSMGATAVLRSAGGRAPAAVDAVCAISAPAEFVSNGSPPVRALSTMITSTTWRALVERALRVRVARRWADPVPAVQVVARVASSPLLLVHGEDDHFFPPEHAERLRRAASSETTLWHEPPGFGHAEDGFSPAFLTRLSAAVAHCARSGGWPERSAMAPPAG